MSTVSLFDISTNVNRLSLWHDAQMSIVSLFDICTNVNRFFRSGVFSCHSSLPLWHYTASHSSSPLWHIQLFSSFSLWHIHLSFIFPPITYTLRLSFIFPALASPEGRPGLSDVSPLSGISELLFDSTLLPPLLFLCLILLLFLFYLLFCLLDHSPELFLENSSTIFR